MNPPYAVSDQVGQSKTQAQSTEREDCSLTKKVTGNGVQYSPIDANFVEFYGPKVSK